MQTLEYLRDFQFAQYATITAILVATAAALLSGLVVLKRMAFVGQGISHAAFGGIGIVAVLGLGGIIGELVIFAFCLGAALLIAVLAQGKTREDTAIGIVLVTTMALGFLLLGLRLELMQYSWYAELMHGAPQPAAWESVLFGSVHLAGQMGMWLSAIVLAIVAGTVFWFRRSLLLYAFDETAAEAAGLPVSRLKAMTMVLLALVVVVGMKLVGVVLITALLVLPGATAALLARRLTTTLLFAWVIAIVGVVGGLFISFEFASLRSGPCIVLVLTLCFAIALLAARKGQA